MADRSSQSAAHLMIVRLSLGCGMAVNAVASLRWFHTASGIHSHSTPRDPPAHRALQPFHALVSAASFSAANLVMGFLGTVPRPTQ